MISIIIASVDGLQLENVKKNISNTIGVIHEVLDFYNARGEKSLCEIYNEGARKAQFEIICFMHEDIEIKTKDWGKIVQFVFNSNDEIGIVGVAGSAYKPLVPSGWFSSGGPLPVNHVNLLQRYKFDKRETFLTYENPNNAKISEVITVDGVWFCTKKKIVEQFAFDEDTFKKFHCYDLDFAITVAQHFKNVVSCEILIEHFSEGNYDRVWLQETLKLHKKWKKKLPISVNQFTKKEIASYEKFAFRFLLKKMNEIGFTKRKKALVLINSNIASKVSLKLSLKLFYEIIAK